MYLQLIKKDIMAIKDVFLLDLRSFSFEKKKVLISEH